MYRQALFVYWRGWGTSGAHADGTGRATKLEPPYRPYSSVLSLHGVQAVVHLHHRGPASRWLVSQLVKALLPEVLRACRSTTLLFRSPDHARGRYDTTIVPCAAGSDVVEVSEPDVAGTGVPRVAGR